MKDDSKIQKGIGSTLVQYRFGRLQRRWSGKDFLYIVGFDEDTQRAFTFQGKVCARYMHEHVQLSFWGNQDVSTRTKTFINTIAVNWANMCEVRYVGSRQFGQTDKHFVLVSTFSMPEDIESSAAQTGFFWVADEVAPRRAQLGLTSSQIFTYVLGRGAGSPSVRLSTG